MIFIIKNLKYKNGKILIKDSMEKTRKDIFPDFNDKNFCDKLKREYSKTFFLKNVNKICEKYSKFWKFYEKKEPKRIKNVEDLKFKNYDDDNNSDNSQNSQVNIEINKDALQKPKNNNKTINDYILFYKQLITISQALPFFLNKISIDEFNENFNYLYSYYLKSIESKYSIISQEIQDFTDFFESLCIILKKSGINLNRYDKINNKLTSNKSLQGNYEKMVPKLVGIPYDIKWEKKKIIQNYNYSHLLTLENVPENKENVKLNLSLYDEKSIQNLNDINNNINNNINDNNNILEYNRVSKGVTNDFILDPTLLYDDNEENINELELESKILLKEKGILKIANEEISKKLAQKDDKQLLKYILKLMTKNKKNLKLLLPAEEDFNEKIPQEYFRIFKDKRDTEFPIVELSDFSNNIFLKLFQKCINLKINQSETSVIIAIDCCRTILKYIKLINVIFACGIANCLDSLEIPYSIVIFADYKFQYVIKDFNEPHSNEILQRLLDCVLVSRYLTRIADACWFIKKKVKCHGREKRAICLISNGLDPKLKIPEKWLPIFDNRDDECFNFFFINSLNEKDNIEYKEIIEIWKNFSSITGVEILDIKIEDIIKENLDYIAISFSKMFTKLKFPDIINTKNKIYKPILLESYVINNEIEEKLISMLKSTINYKNIYIQNKPHINSKSKKI